MKKFGLVCKIRQANPYRRMMKAMQTDSVAKNLLNRQLKELGVRMALLTDITYLFYGKYRKKAYLSTIKDAYTCEILAYVVSESLEVDFVLETITQMVDKQGEELKQQKKLIHSDQGVHYTSIQFQNLIEDKKLRQSISRRANC